MRRLLICIAFCVAGMAQLAAQAQSSFPSRAIRLVVPAAAGGSNSIIGQLLCERLQANLGQGCYVDNKGGGGGVIGADVVVKAPPDGHTVLLTFGGPVATGLALLNNVPYDPARDLIPVARVAEVPLVMVASTQFPVHSVKEVIDYGKANPGKLSASINSFGAMGHLLTEQFRLDNALNINEIPYKGTGQALPDIISGRINIAVDTVPALQSFIKAGKLNALAVASAKRTDVLPNVPTFGELGIPNMEVTTWFAMFVPAGTPKPVVDKLSAETQKVLNMPDVRQKLSEQGVTVNYAPPAETAAFVRSETEKWTRIIKTAGMKPE